MARAKVAAMPAQLLQMIRTGGYRLDAGHVARLGGLYIKAYEVVDRSWTWPFCVVGSVVGWISTCLVHR